MAPQVWKRLLSGPLQKGLQTVDVLMSLPSLNTWGPLSINFWPPGSQSSSLALEPWSPFKEEPPTLPGLGGIVNQGWGMRPQLGVRFSLDSGLPVEWGTVDLSYW